MRTTLIILFTSGIIQEIKTTWINDWDFSNMFGLVGKECVIKILGTNTYINMAHVSLLTMKHE